jgi:cytochrome o ubiquinol oxidase subunit 3
MNVAVAVDDGVRHEARASASEAGPAAKRVVVGYGFWIFLLSDIVMFSAFFAGYAVLAHATAGGPGGVQLFNQRSVAIETGCLLASSYTCGLMSLAVTSRRYVFTYLTALMTFVLGVWFLALEFREFAGMIAIGAGPQRSAFLSAFFTLVGCHGLHVTAGLVWLAVMSSGRNQGLVSRDRRAASALLFTVLACARHRLGMAVHGGLSDGSPLMTDTQYDRAPGDASALPDVEQGTSSGVLVYTIGLALAVVLTAMSFWVANTTLLWAGGVSLGLTVLAIAQMGIHLVFFLHVTTGPDNTNNVMALAFGVLIVALVVVGSLLIMADLNDNMMPAAELMNLQMQH